MQRSEAVSVESPLSAAGSPATSRYRRVVEILDRASAGSTASYQGYGPFWRLPYEEFLEFSLYGIRMIAPGPERSTAAGATTPPPPAAPAVVVTIGGLGGAAPPPSAAPAFGARSAASGLIKGLRGLPPFDGGQFPRLPWGGQPIS